jgi:hypothetical protein
MSGEFLPYPKTPPVTSVGRAANGGGLPGGVIYKEHRWLEIPIALVVVDASTEAGRLVWVGSDCAHGVWLTPAEFCKLVGQVSDFLVGGDQEFSALASGGPKA